MRWSYKTVHYELQKEGLLGSTFLDESEVEKSLNEYGKAGWELVSIMETLDGLIAVFKQPLSYDNDSFYSHSKETAATNSAAKPDRPSEESNVTAVKKDEEVFVVQQDTTVKKTKVLDEHESIDESIDDEPSVDVGSIRIE